jgi:quercetin dioxygenase-like cupin family protein
LILLSVTKQFNCQPIIRFYIHKPFTSSLDLHKLLMATLINLQTIQSPKGKLTVFERLLNNDIKRVFYIYETTEQVRGKHRHKESTHAIICVSGGCKIYVNDGNEENIFKINSPEQCLIIKPEEWREMYDFTEGTILLCMSNQYFDIEDYIYQPYENSTKIKYMLSEN